MPDGMMKKPSKLKAVKPTLSLPSKPKILVYGKPGVGKTWLALDFPAVYYIDVEGGAKQPEYIAKLEASGGMYFGPEHGSLEFSEVLGQVQALGTEEHGFRTIVIDSVSKLFALEVAREYERLEKKGEKIEFSKEKKPATSYMRRLVAWLMRIDMNAILIAHSRDEWGKDDKGNREVIGETFDCWDKLEYELDLAINVVKASPLRRVGRVRKTRLAAFPEAATFDWSFDAFAERYGRDTIFRDVQVISLASEDQVTEIKRLLGIVKMPEGWEEKCLSKAKAETWSEVDAESIAKCIDVLKSKVTA